MTQRKLTRRQAWRIEKIQDERLQRARRKAQHAADALGDQSLGSELFGLLLANYGPYVLVEDEAGAAHRCVIRQNLGALVSGDRVVWQPSTVGDGVVVAVEPRRSLLARPDPGGQMRPIAANIDQVIVVAAPQPGVQLGLIDRYLVAAENTGLAPVILINKIDLLNAAEREQLEAELREYRTIGYPVLYASTRSEHGLDALTAQLHGRTSIFVGLSGVGKSSLINALLPEAAARVGELSASTGRGQHTTSAAMLYHLPGGGNIIDSPGVREFGLWQMSAEDILRGFAEFRLYLGKCRFRNCRHLTEPGCALRQAVAEHHISARRLESYQRIVTSLGED